MDLHIHDVDFLTFLFGMPLRLTAKNTINREKGIDVVTADFVFEKTLAGIESGWIGKFGFIMEYKAVFEERVVKFQNGRFQVFDTARGDFADEPVSPEGGHLLELEYFFDCVRTNTRPVLCPPEASRDAIRLLELERKSIQTGREIRV
jgi:predicted dehydrogenase